jgi:predicted Zn-dependent protease
LYQELLENAPTVVERITAEARSIVEKGKEKAEKKGGNASPEFLNTHPADDTRIANIKRLMPEVLEYYKDQ